jgi:hypothetical protein
MFAFDTSSKKKYLLSEKEKDSNSHQWYKDQANNLIKYNYRNNIYGVLDDSYTLGDNSPLDSFWNKKTNYDLFNGILNKSDLKYVYHPLGDAVGELPANMTNRDILSPKIKALLGIEMSLPFSWKVIATNRQATTRKEQKETEMLKDFVVSTIMQPIQQQVQQEQQEQTKGRQLTPAEQQQLQEQMQQEIQQKTPDEVNRYMTREHQDPAEVLARQILEYLTQEERIPEKFNDAFKHLHLSGTEVLRPVIINNNPVLQVVNSLYFDHDNSPEVKYVEDGAWAVAELRYTPNQVLTELGTELTEDEIERVYAYEREAFSSMNGGFNFLRTGINDDFKISVFHCTWKAPMKIGFLSYINTANQLSEKIVSEDYKLNNKAGDLRIEWVWIPQAYEVYKMLDDIYVYPRQCPGQDKDLNNLWKSKLPYYGASCDNVNSPITALIERGKSYQYYYDIILYRVELLMASDKGKIIAMNIHTIPETKGINLQKMIYYMEANKLLLVDPKQEGNKPGTAGAVGGEIGNLVKEIDMSLVSQIDAYIKIADYIEEKCGAAMGINKAMEGAIGPTEAVTNSKQNLIQSNYIIRPYIELHNQVKRNVLQAMIETAKVAWSTNPPDKLFYVLDDMSVQMLQIDQHLLDASSYGVFVSNSAKSEEVRQAMIQLAQTAMQNQKADLVDIAIIFESNSVQEALEQLKIAREQADQREQAMEQQKLDFQKQQEALEDERIAKKYAHEKEMLILKETEERKTELQKQVIMSMGFNQDKNMDKDAQLDIMEVYRNGVDANIKLQKQALEQQNQNLQERSQGLEEQKFQQQQKMDSHQQNIDKQKVAIDKQKATSRPTSKAK